MCREMDNTILYKPTSSIDRARGVFTVVDHVKQRHGRMKRNAWVDRGPFTCCQCGFSRRQRLTSASSTSLPAPVRYTRSERRDIRMAPCNRVRDGYHLICASTRGRNDEPVVCVCVCVLCVVSWYIAHLSWRVRRNRGLVQCMHAEPNQRIQGGWAWSTHTR